VQHAHVITALLAGAVAGFRHTFKKDSNAFPVCAAHHVNVTHDCVHCTPGLDAHPPPMQADVLTPARHGVVV